MKDLAALLLFLGVLIIGGWLVSEVADAGSAHTFIRNHLPQETADYGC